MKKLLFLIMFICMSSFVFAGDLDNASQYFSFDDANKDASFIYDQSSNMLNGTITGSPTNISFVLNEGINFTVNNQKVSFTEQTLSAWSWGCEVNYYGISSNYVMLVGGTTPNYIGFNAVKNKLVFRNDAISETTFSGFNRPTINTNFHVAITYNGSNYEAYENGVSVGTVAGAAQSQKFIQYGDVLDSVYDTKGALDECFLYNFALNSTQISSLYNGGSLFNPYTEVPTDTCTCPGINQDWEIDHGDACNIVDACDLGTGTLTFTGTGTTTCDATIDTTDLGDPGSGGILLINDECIINID